MGNLLWNTTDLFIRGVIGCGTYFKICIDIFKPDGFTHMHTCTCMRTHNHTGVESTQLSGKQVTPICGWREYPYLKCKPVIPSLYGLGEYFSEVDKS